MKKVYMDNNATTRVRDEVIEAMLPYFGKVYGNASSIHQFGRGARTAVDAARQKVAALIGASSGEEIIFTSGGTEADNFAIKGVTSALRAKGNHIITSTIEHHAVLNACKFLEKEGCKVTYVGVDEYGVVKLDELKKAITDKTILISIMHANNEVGTIEPIEEIGKIAKERGIYFHTDAVQAVGKLPIDLTKLNVDLLSLSGHKLYGPKGVGALYIRKGTKITPQMHGGHHEMGKRAGTENVPGLVGLACACELAAGEIASEGKKLTELRDYFYKGIISRITDVRLNGHPEKRLANTLNVGFKYLEGESIILNLDMEGVGVSTGSACTSGSLEPSHVLTAMGIDPAETQGSVRFSLGRDNTKEDVDYVLEVLPPIIKRLRAMSPLYEDKMRKG
ncbi:MAG: cysteine desulfurase NifS [Candidatus Omnitrophica bacterium]|nr:cysteine desulfurase NifS [Candidatus Omnitrophota bacterium]